MTGDVYPTTGECYKVNDNALLLTPQKAKRLKKCVEVIGQYGKFNEGQDGFQALLELRLFFDEAVGSLSPYGYCPHCGKAGVSRERRLDGNDKCEGGHVYPSRASRSN